MLIFLVLFVLCGCLKTDVIERQSIVLAIGYDGKKNKNFQVSLTFLEAVRANKEANRSISVEASTSRFARTKINAMLPYKIVTGQTRVILLDKNLFKLNMLNEIDVLSRDPEFGDMIKIAIVEGTAQDVITYSYENYKNIGVSLNSLLDQNAESNWVPSLTLHDFAFGRDTPTLQLVIPIIKRDGEEISVTSLALLNGSHIVGEATPKEGFFIKTLRKKNTNYLYEVILNKEEMKASGMDRYLAHIPEEVKVVFQVINSNGKIKLVDPNMKKFNAKIDLDVVIEEVSQRYMFKESGAIETLEHQLEIKLTKDLQHFLDKIRAINSDCVGFGEKYRSLSSNSSQVMEQWNDIFPNTILSGELDITMIRTGIIE